MPMIDFSVVVLPAPFRPSNVTTSPGRTSKSTPWRTCDSSYQACRSRTARSGVPEGPAVEPMAGRATASGMAGPHVGLDDVRIPRYRSVVALGQHLAAGQHGDRLGQVLHHPQVVLH